MSAYHFDYDFTSTAFLLSDMPDADGRFLSVIRLSGADPKGRIRAQIIYSTMSVDELADIVDDPYEAAYPGSK